MFLDPRDILDHARSQQRAADRLPLGTGPCGALCDRSCGECLQVRPPQTSEPTSRSLPAPTVVRSAAGTHTRVHRLDNHFAWLSVALHLSAANGRRQA